MDIVALVLALVALGGMVFNWTRISEQVKVNRTTSDMLGRLAQRQAEQEAKIRFMTSTDGARVSTSEN